jgi:hypothetical protein
LELTEVVAGWDLSDLVWSRVPLTPSYIGLKTSLPFQTNPKMTEISSTLRILVIQPDMYYYCFFFNHLRNT